MRNYSTADPEHNTYALAIADAIGRHTEAARKAAEMGTEPEPTIVEVPGGRWTLTYGDVVPRWQVQRSDGKTLRFDQGIDPVAAVMRACDNERPIPFVLTDEGEAAAQVIAHA